ncbi:MAG: 16S rRNA (uracil(1498)-N(3))-methyltransferase [Leptolyngbyaceae cyanobacterium bins.302]|nr:16S rRNA (uracil(1498)-N(3))-methyltransferase [Leptolyngbyaceae cyanobacterium bins.302]
MLQRVVVDPAQMQPPTIHLTAEQHHYLTRVLRLKVGDRFIVMDGQGHSWLAQLEAQPEAKPEPYPATILEAILAQTELPIAITLVIALPKGNAFDDVVRQATELGVSQILPVISDRTLLNPSPQKLDRWRRIAQEAAEQSERQIVPALLDPIPFANHLQQISHRSHCDRYYLCTPRHSAPHLLAQIRSPFPIPQPPSPNSPSSIPSISLAIGPEGGWTDAEIEQAIAAGYQLASLGDRILRTVTAPIVALALVAAASESETAYLELPCTLLEL